ncbi:MAG: hypothetical protein FK734_19940 [Asgard group archaeon]|nr:hypothetical protein [Asgard group archaeon]
MNKNKKILSLFLGLLFLGSIFGQFLLNNIQLATASTNTSDSIESYFDGFEDENFTASRWEFESEDHFAFDDVWEMEGTKCLAGLCISGKTYDGVQFYQSMTDGSIEAKIRARLSQYQCGALWLRTGELEAVYDPDKPSFTSGYMARLYNDKLRISKWENDNWTILGEDDLGYLWHNKIWYLKFEITGNSLYAYAESGLYSAELELTDNSLTSGKAGFSLRTNLDPERYIYIDEITVKQNVDAIKDGFEQETNAGWSYAREELFEQVYYSPSKEGSNSLKAVGPGGVNYDGVQNHYSFEDGSIEAWVKPHGSNYLTPSLWLRTGNLRTESSYIISYSNGYFLRIYLDKARIFRTDGTNNFQLAECNIGDIVGKWWHMKIKITGTLLEGWVTESSTFSNIPQLSYDTKDDEIKISSGKAGLSARLTMASYYYTYFDDVKIKTTHKHPVDEQTNLYAIIVGVGEEPRFSIDAYNFYKTLSQWYGLKRINTKLAIQMEEIDGETIVDNIYTGISKNTVYGLFNGLQSTTNDIVIIWWSGHGKAEGSFEIVKGDEIEGKPEEKVYDYEFAQWLNIPCLQMYVFLGPCYSGTFLDDIGGVSNRAVYTSAQADSTGDPADDHSLFPWATYRGLHPYLDKELADNNSDGVISLYELFTYCEYFVLKYKDYNHPQVPQRDPNMILDDTLYDICGNEIN